MISSTKGMIIEAHKGAVIIILKEHRKAVTNETSSQWGMGDSKRKKVIQNYRLYIILLFNTLAVNFRLQAQSLKVKQKNPEKWEGRIHMCKHESES